MELGLRLLAYFAAALAAAQGAFNGGHLVASAGHFMTSLGSHLRVCASDAFRPPTCHIYLNTYIYSLDSIPPPLSLYLLWGRGEGQLICYRTEGGFSTGNREWALS